VTLDRAHPGEAAPDQSDRMRAARVFTTPRPTTAWGMPQAALASGGVY